MKIKSFPLLLSLVVVFSHALTLSPQAVVADELKEESCINEACFSNTSVLADKTIELRGSSLYEYFVVDVYAAALYLPKQTASATVLSDVPKKLVLHYFRDLKKSDFIESGEFLMKKDPTFIKEKLSVSLETLYALLEDVKAGDRYTLTYIPGTGTELTLNDTVKGVIPGEEFAKRYFGIWLSDKYSVDEAFTKRLLGL